MLISNLIRIVIRGLYSKYLDEIYIPLGTTAYLDRLPKTHGKKWGRACSVRLTYPRDNAFIRRGQRETYIFKVTESDNGIIYESDTD